MKGPKGLKLFEFISQLYHYETIGWNWRDNLGDIVSFIGNTLRLLRRHENRISSFIGFPNGQCQECSMAVKIKSKYVYQVDMKITDCKAITIRDILRNVVLSNGIKKCCLEFLRLETKVEKYVVFDFLNQINIKISTGESIWGKKFQYISHVEQKNEADQESQCSFWINGRLSLM